MVLCTRFYFRTWRYLQICHRSISTRYLKPAIMTTANSKIGKSINLSAHVITAEEFALLFRAVHYVAARKEKVENVDKNLENGETSENSDNISGTLSNSPTKDTDGKRIGISDISNIVTSDSVVTGNSVGQSIKGDSFAQLVLKFGTDLSPKSIGSSDSDHASTSIDSNSGQVDSQSDQTEKSIEDSVIKTPFQRFRGKYLTVTDFAGQLWCEQQLDYKYDPPPGVVISEKPQMATGTDLHLARELEIQEIVEVEITSREDAFALKLLNLIACLRDFLTGEYSVRREIPIFGAPFGLGLFVVGIIDEVRYDSKARKVDIVELKTRLTPKLPSKAQKRTHDLQVMLYRRMWNDLATGQLPKQEIIKHVQLQADACLGEEISTQIRTLKMFSKSATIILDDFLDRFFYEMARLPPADQLILEYCHQETKEQFAVDEIPYKEDWLEQQLEQASLYWKGERGPRGVDIEETWKCRYCDFVDVCAWRMKKQEECASRNTRNFNGAAIVLPFGKE